MSDDPMWTLVMFDLPTKHACQRREASAFRNHLLDLGFAMTQLSVYVRYTPSSTGISKAVASIKRNLPEGGEVRILRITDHQWSQAVRFRNGDDSHDSGAPDELLLFDAS